VKDSRVADSIAELTEVSVATMPAAAITGTPTRGQKIFAASVNAVSDPANAEYGITPMVTNETRV